MTSRSLNKICRILASATAIQIGVVGPATAAPNPKQWTPAEDLVAECKTDTSKPIRFKERGSLPAGTQLTPENFYPENYTTGDMLVSCKLRVAETKVLWREFESAPAAWNDQDRVFEVKQDDLLVQLSGGMPFMRTKVVVFRKALPLAPTSSPKPAKTVRSPTKAASP